MKLEFRLVTVSSLRSLAIAKAVASVLAGFSLSDALAQSLTFVPAGQLPVTAGAGIWETTYARWFDGTAFMAYPGGLTNTNTAVFAGGAVQLSATDIISAQNITLQGNTTFYGPQVGPVANLLLTNDAVIDTGPHTLTSIHSLRAATAGSTWTKTGSGALLIHRGLGLGAAGTLNLNQGTIGFLNSGADLSESTWLNISSGATLDMAAANGPVSDGFGMFSGMGNIRLGTFTNLGANVGSSLTAGTLNTGVATYSGTISGGGRFQKVGTGTLVFDGANTYTGPTSIQAGSLRLDTATALPSTADVFLSNVAGVQLVLTTHKTLGSIGGGGTTGGVIDIGATTLTIGANNSYNSFGGNLTGTGTLVKTGTNLATISGGTPVSAYGGSYRVEGGILSFVNDTRIGAAGAGTMTLAGGTISNSISGGFVWSASRTINVESASNFQVLGSTASLLSIEAALTGSSALTKYGDGNLNLNADNAAFSGDWNIRDGSFSTTRTTGTPFGTGGVNVRGATVNVAPGVSGGAIAHTIASGAGETFAFGPGSILNLNKNAGNTDLTLTIGAPAATGSTLVRNARGTLVVQAATGIGSLGTAGGERVLVNGGVATTNGIVPGVFGLTGATSSFGHLLNYDNTNGLLVATYSSTDITTAGATDVVNQTTAATLGGAGSVYAVRIGDGTAAGAVVDLGGNTLTVGTGSDPAMVVINQASAFTNGTVDFGSRMGTIYTQGATAAVTAVLAGSDGLSKVGPGPLTLSTAATYTGPTHVGQGTIVLGVNNALPTATDLIIEGNGALNVGALSQTIASLNGNRVANIIMTAGGQLTVGSGASTYLGRINVGGTAAGTLVKDGSGVLTLGVANSQSGNDSEALLYSKLAVRNGGVVSIGSSASLPAPATGTPVADAITLDNGTLRFTEVNSAGQGSGASSSFNLSGSNATLRGITIGVGGGTIEVSEAKEIVLFQRGNNAVIGTDDAPLISGSGVFTKTGPGFLRLGIGNDASFTGKFVIKGGNIQFQDGRSLGTAANYTPDFITLDGGMIQTNGLGTFTTNQGITVAAGGGTINAGFTFSQEFRGSGPFTKITTSSANFNAPSPLWSSPINIRAGIISANANDALGTGDITITPTLQSGLSKIGSSVADVTLNNNIVLNTGSTIDVRVDANTFTWNGNVSGPGGFIKTGGAAITGTLSLAGNNSFAGDLIIDGGIVLAKSNTALGAATGLIMVNPNTTLAFEGGINHALGKPLFISGTGLSALGALWNVSGDNTYGGAVTVHQDASIEIQAGNLSLPGGLRGASALNVNGTGNLNAGGIRVSTLSVNNPKIAITPGRSTSKTSKIGTLNLGANILDLADNDLVVSNTTDTAVGALIASAYTPSGTWTGQGITSSVAALPANSNKALGYAEASDVLGAGPYPLPFSGVSVDSAADVLVRYTYRGDANLDGQVSSTDFNLSVGNSANYGLTSGAVWVQGDFNYDGKVNTIDFNYLAGNFGAAPIASALPDAGPSLGSVVPEPSSLSLLALGMAGIAARRRKA